jgi:hypothetical protein
MKTVFCFARPFSDSLDAVHFVEDGLGDEEEVY